MNLDIVEVKNARRTDNDLFIDCDVLFNGFSEFYPYTASSKDQISADFYFKLVSGYYGEVLPFVPYIPTVQEIKQQRTIELASIRYQHETSGITLNGATIDTSRESQALVNGAYSYSLLNPNVLIDWKAESGWIQIDATTIAGIAAAVAAHVQACFSNERAMSEAIAAAETVADVQAIDLNTGWPA